MKFSDLLKKLYQESEFSSMSSLSECAGVTLGFTERTMKGLNTTEKIDALFETLTRDLTEDEVLKAIGLVKLARQDYGQSVN